MVPADYKGVISITDIESFLREYSRAKYKIKQLECELISKMKSADDVVMMPGHGYDAVRSKNKKISKPTEKIAVMLVDHYGEEIKRIEGELSGERAIMRDIDELIRRAGLDATEKQFVDCHYKKGFSVEKTMSEIFCSRRTAYRIRIKALDKLETARKANTLPRAYNV